MGKRKIVHIELSSLDHDAAKDFYGKVFGWEFIDYPEVNYVTSDPDPVGVGFSPVGENDNQGQVMVYLHSDDIEADLEAITANGGTVIAPKFEIPNVGYSAVFTDPAGNHVALMQPPA